MPFFSIIVPTYNSSATINITIASILQQTYTGFEILVIDGLSKDNTVATVKAFNDERIKIISEKDNGIYDAMNKGIKLAQGEWMYFLGSDDSLYNCNVLESVRSFVEEKNYYFVYGNVQIDGYTVWANNKDIYDGEFSLHKLMSKNICHQSIFYFRKKIIENDIIYKTIYPICSDWDFNLKCWSIAPFVYMPHIIANFSGGGSSSLANTNDSFHNNLVSHVIEYFNLKSYYSIKKILPESLYWQLLFIGKYKNYYKIENFLKRFLKLNEIKTYRNIRRKQ